MNVVILVIIYFNPYPIFSVREKIIETKSTEFKIVTKKDLSSSQYRNNTALNFREAMLFNSKRVKREPHSMKKVRVEKRKAGRIGKEFGV